MIKLERFTGLRCLYRAVDFLIMEGQNLSAIAPSFVPLGGALGSARQAWVLIAALVMLPTVYLRNLGLLAYLSAAGVLTSLSLTCLVGTIAAEHGELLQTCVAVELCSSPMCQSAGFTLVPSIHVPGELLFPNELIAAWCQGAGIDVDMESAAV